MEKRERRIENSLQCSFQTKRGEAQCVRIPKLLVPAAALGRFKPP